ncbi:PREDICTED: uncharacterized protein LOC107351633 isoform X1 [Acropora digitifera]|uniref:uncharacterized protein LOC107351633 isoform X1 n=1 Tax=Acropora digitifera TaxID=70779 RepID=UPI00077A645D|nr:PREDICTED: uncharacterized protein LOC107351633 isoform X1 [Acropora digitifera]XP_015773415.1 PREDICTED: uncharacterized protein LOC107351633 isoform X1 [Acropora digitifera]
METYEQMIKDTRQWLREADKVVSEVTQQQLARLETSERVLQHIRLQNETDTHNETYERICINFLDNIVLSTRVALISKATHNMSEGKSDLSEILPKIGEIGGYLQELESKKNEIDRVRKQIEEMTESRNYELTRRENERMETLVSRVEHESKRFKNYFNEADKTLTSLHSDVVSYINNKGLSGWNVFLPVAAGAGASALGVAFFPVVAPAAAVSGGGFFAGVGTLKTGVRGKELNVAILFGASVGFAVSGFRLCLQLKRWYATRNFCYRLCSIMQNYSDKVDEMNRLLNSMRM